MYPKHYEIKCKLDRASLSEREASEDASTKRQKATDALKEAAAWKKAADHANRVAELARWMSRDSLEEAERLQKVAKDAEETAEDARVEKDSAKSELEAVEAAINIYRRIQQ
jgi:cell division septum initiation protein DivIVA